MPSASDPVSLLVNSYAVSGWESVRITRRCEGLPNDFELSFSSSDPATGQTEFAYANDPVQVKIGPDLVITGYLDDDGHDISPEEHTLTVTGRGKTRDLVDCSAQWKGGLIQGVNLQQLCQKLGEPYGITAQMVGGLQPAGQIPALALNYGEPCAEIIARVARNQRALYYEGPDGNLLLAQVGVDQAASGVIYGENVQRWSVRNSMAERFSTIYCAQFSTNPVYDQGDGSFNLFGAVYDENVVWPRTLIINTEGLSKEVADAKAQWELARRAGRGTIVRARVDSWRDEGGALWAPNTLIPCQGPGLRWRPVSSSGPAPSASPGPVLLVLSEVTYRYDEGGGTVADLVLMPPEAFSPEPIQLQPPEPDISPIGGPARTPSF